MRGGWLVSVPGEEDGLCPGGGAYAQDGSVQGVSVPGISIQGVSVQGVSVQGNLCPGGLCPGGLCPGGLCLGHPTGMHSVIDKDRWQVDY